MSRSLRSWVRVASLAAFSLAICAAATTRADTIAKWTFDGAETAFLADSEHTNNLANAGAVLQSGITATGTGSSAYFNGSSTSYLATANSLNLTSYKNLRITWSQLITSDNEGIVFEHSENANNNNGAFYFDTNARSLDVTDPGTGAVTLRNAEAVEGFNGVGFTNLHGEGNTTWENMQLDINLNAASNTAVIAVYRGGELISSNSSWPFGSGYANAPNAFGDYVLNIGARSGGVAVFTGYIDNLTVSTIPEPSTIAILTTGLIGLLAYAWRKRR